MEGRGLYHQQGEKEGAAMKTKLRMALTAAIGFAAGYLVGRRDIKPPWWLLAIFALVCIRAGALVAYAAERIAYTAQGMNTYDIMLATLLLLLAIIIIGKR